MNHRTYYAFLLGDIDRKEAMRILGVSERTMYHILGKQRRELIESIQKWEVELHKQYPF